MHWWTVRYLAIRTLHKPEGCRHLFASTSHIRCGLTVRSPGCLSAIQIARSHQGAQEKSQQELPPEPRQPPGVWRNDEVQEGQEDQQVSQAAAEG